VERKMNVRLTVVLNIHEQSTEFNIQKPSRP
jgi:hypothetical protein